MGAQPCWSGLHMLRSGVQAVSRAPLHGGQSGSTWEAGWVLGRCRGGQLVHQHCTRRTRAEQDPAGEWGAFSKERSTGAPFLTPRSLYPALYLLHTLRLSSILPPFLPQIDTLAEMWFSCVFLYETAFLPFPSRIPPTCPTNLFSPGI